MIKFYNKLKKHKCRSVSDGSNRLTVSLQCLHRQLFDVSGSLKEDVRQYTSCPVCSSFSSKIYWIKDGFIHVKCNNCGLVYLNPRLNKAATLSFYNSKANEVYNENKFHSKSRFSADDIINIENANILKKYFDFSSPKIGLHNQKVIEIGCATGVFLKLMKEYGAVTYGVELNAKNVERALINGIDFVYSKDLLELNLPSGYFDIVYARDVIEHLINPNIYFHELNRILKPGGLLFLETHNVNSVIHRIVKGRHTCVFGFEHPVHWSDITLTTALNRNGFFVEEVMFRSSDLDPVTIVDYFRKSTWTTIYPWKANFISNLCLLILSIFLKITAINYLIGKISQTIANKISMGSTMKLIAKKSV